MRKLTGLICLAAVLYALPAFAERTRPIIVRDNVDRSAARLQPADQLVRLGNREDFLAHNTAAVYGTVYNREGFTSYGYSTPCSGGCLAEDYDSINDEDIVLGTFDFYIDNMDGGNVWITWFDSASSFVGSWGYGIPAGTGWYGVPLGGNPTLPDAGFVQFWFDGHQGRMITTPSTNAGQVGTSGAGYWVDGVLEDTAACVVEPTGTCDGLFMAFDSVLPGACCGTLFHSCTEGVVEDACAGLWTAVTAGGTCDPDTCPPGTCGNGVPDPGEECDDGNNVNGDGCSAICQNEVTYIPAVSEWGLLVMALLGLTVGTVLFGRRRAAA
jgi:cysteine-rich repeat protein